MPAFNAVRTVHRKLLNLAQYQHFGHVRHTRELYLQLMQECLIGSIYQDPPIPTWGAKVFDSNLREYGWDWPSVAHSMIGRQRMSNLRKLAESVLFNRIPGDFMETGVWRGGACIFLRAILSAFGVKDRRVWAADSFEGLPPPNGLTYPADKDDQFHTYRELAIGLDEVKANFSRYGLLDDQVVFLKGWFKDTLPSCSTGPLSLLRLDGDMYESTIDALSHLYERLSPGGYLIVDDYHVVEGCRQAVNSYRSQFNINDPIIEIDRVGVYWQKGFGND